MHSIICFGTFLLFANIICYFSFSRIGMYTHFSTFIGVIIVSIITFSIFLLNSTRLQDDTMSEKEKNKKYFLLSVKTLSILALFLMVSFFIYIDLRFNLAERLHLKRCVTATILSIIVFYCCIWPLIYFGIIEIIEKSIKEYRCNRIELSENNSKRIVIREIKWWQDLILMLICWGFPYYIILCSCFHLIDNISSSFVNFLLIIWIPGVFFRFTSKVKDNKYVKIKKYPEIIIAIIFVLLLIYKYLKIVYIL